MNKTVIKIIIGVLVIGGIGSVVYRGVIRDESIISQNEIIKEGSSTVSQGTSSDVVMKKEGDAMMKKEGTVMEKKDAMMKDGGSSTNSISFSGSVLAGVSAPLLDFKKSDYDQAVASGKLVLLYFYADWCPICRAEFPKMQSAFNKLETDQIIAFRVNYKDDFTDSDEVSLAKQFGVAYQHTKVFLKNGTLVSKHPDSWEENRYLSEINNRLK